MLSTNFENVGELSAAISVVFYYVMNGCHYIGNCALAVWKTNLT